MKFQSQSQPHQQVKRMPPNPSPIPFEKYYPKPSNKSQEGFYLRVNHNIR